MNPRSAVDDADAAGSTALFWAVTCGDFDTASRLLLCGSDPKHVDLYGRTPLQQAIVTGGVAVMNLLLATKTDVNHKDRRGVTAIHMASAKQDGATTMELVESNGADIQSQDDTGLRPCIMQHATVYPRTYGIY